MLCHRPRVVEGSNVIATYNIASYNVIRRPAQTPARTRNVLRCHWGLWDVLSARGLNRKRHPGLKVKSGAQFPPEDRFGKGIPFWSQILGRTFRQACHPESASRSEPEFWDALSAERLPFFKKYTSLNLPGLHNLLPFTGADHRPPIRM